MKRAFLIYNKGRMRLSLRLTLVFSLFGAIIAGGFQYHHIQVTRRQTYERALHMADVTVRAVKVLVEGHARAGRFREMRKDLSTMIRQAGVAYVVVEDARGRKLAARYDSEDILNREPHRGVPMREVTDGIYDMETPASLGRRGEGILFIGIRIAKIQAELRDIERDAVAAGVMAFLAITLTAWLIGAWFGLRIERLVPRIEALPRDPEHFRPLRVLDSSDEVGRLAVAFNRLGATLKSEVLRRRELEKEKQELSAMLIHDLKSPLTVIRSGITLLSEQLKDRRGKNKNGGRPLKRRAGETGHRRTFELLDMSTDRLQRMLEDVLQLASMEEVEGLRERIPVDISAMARACMKDFDLVVAERKQKLDYKISKEGALVMGDPMLLRRVLDNLMQNAVEHTPAGAKIHVQVETSEKTVTASVSDGGPGIPVEVRHEIFSKFFQKDLKRHVGNVGLGLALCEKVIHRPGGEIGVADAKGKGARFYFTLPRSYGEGGSAPS